MARREEEKIKSHDAAEIAPEVSIWCGDGFEVLVELFPGKQAWAVGEDDVMLRVAFFGYRRRRDQEDSA